MPEYKIEVNININCNDHKVDRCIEMLEKLLTQGKRIMSEIDDANSALQSINDATNQMANFQQTIADEMNTLIANAKPGSTITPEFLAGLQSTAGKVQALIPGLQAIASAGAANPVPVPVPTPTA